MARDRSKLFIDVDKTLKDHSIIGRDVDNLVATVAAIAAIDTQRPTVRPEVRAYTLTAEGKIAESLPFWVQALQENPDDVSIAARYADALADIGKNEQLAELIETTRFDSFENIYYLLRAHRNHEVIEKASEYLDESAGFDEEFDYARAAVRINRAIALKRLERTDEMNEDLKYLQKNGASDDVNIKAGVAALMKDRKTMMAALRAALGNNLTRTDLMRFPVFEDYQNDEEFLQLIAGEPYDQLAR